MRLCCKHGNGVCLNCKRQPTKDMGDICRYKAEDRLGAFEELLFTNLSDEQKDILRDLGIVVDAIE